MRNRTKIFGMAIKIHHLIHNKLFFKSIPKLSNIHQKCPKTYPTAYNKIE